MSRCRSKRFRFQKYKASISSPQVKERLIPDFQGDLVVRIAKSKKHQIKKGIPKYFGGVHTHAIDVVHKVNAITMCGMTVLNRDNAPEMDLEKDINIDYKASGIYPLSCKRYLHEIRRRAEFKLDGRCLLITKQCKLMRDNVKFQDFQKMGFVLNLRESFENGDIFKLRENPTLLGNYIDHIAKLAIGIESDFVMPEEFLNKTNKDLLEEYEKIINRKKSKEHSDIDYNYYSTLKQKYSNKWNITTTSTDSSYFSIDSPTSTSWVYRISS